MSDCLRSVLQGLPDHSEGGLELISASPQILQPGEICMPFTWWTGGRDPSQVLWHMVLDPTAPQRLFCLWMDVKLFCFVLFCISEGRLIWPSYWVHSSFRDYFLSRYIFLSLFLLYIFWVIFLVITVIIAIYHNLVQIKQF